MAASHSPLPGRALAGLLLIGLRAPAAESGDLSRQTPVPANEPIPVVDFFRPSLVKNPRVNRAGTHFAAFYSAGDDRVSVMIYDFDRAKFSWLTAPGESAVRGFDWLDDSNLVWILSYPQAILAVDIRHPSQAHPILQLSTVQLVGVPERNRLEPLVWLRSDVFHQRMDGGVVQVDSQVRKGDLVGHVAELTRSEFERVRNSNLDHILRTYPTPGEDRVVRYLTDKEGELAFAITSKDGVETLHRLTGDHWETCPIDLDKIDVIDSGNQPGELVVRGPRGTGKPRPLQFMDAATGTPGETLLVLKDHDFSGGLIREPAHHLIIGAEHETTGPQTTWFTNEYGALQKMLTEDENLRGRAVRIMGSDVPQRRFLVGAFSDRQPSIYYLLEVEKRSLALIKSSRPWIDPARMQPMSIMQYKTRDGRRFDAYVTLPAGASKEHPAPLVVLPHEYYGVRDSWGYHSEAQFLASRGFAVLQPNYRGNAGYGWQFTREEEWDFRRMSDDITDATRALLTSGYIDPKRVGIMGTGTAAYLALSGAVFEPDLYRTCVVIAGIFDWGDVIKEEKYYQYDTSFYATALRFLGDPQKVPEKFDAFTPLRHVDRLRAATFVDYVRYEPLILAQSRRLISELEKYHVPHEVFQAGDEFRGRVHLSDQVEPYSRIEEFLARNLAAAP